MLSAHFPEYRIDSPMIRLVSETLRGRVDRLWMGQSLAVDPHAVFSHCAAVAPGLAFGTSVSLMGLRHPVDAALHASSVATLSRKPFIAGLGPGAVEFQRSVLGAPYPSQLQAVRTYVEGFRTGLLSTGNTQVQVGLGVLRPGMARLAGEIADVAVTWLCPPNYHSDVVRPALAEAAARAGRPVPHLVAVVHAAGPTALADPGRYLLGVSERHLQGPHYRDMLRRAGIPVSDDPNRTARHVVESGAFVHGDRDAVTAGIQRFRDSGVDEVVLNTTSSAVQDGPLTGLRDLAAMLPARPADPDQSNR